MWIHFGYGRIGKGAITQFLNYNSNQLEFKYAILDRNIHFPKTDSIEIKNVNFNLLIRNINLSTIDSIDWSKVKVISTSLTSNGFKEMLPKIIKLIPKNSKIALVPFENDLELINFAKKNVNQKRITVIETLIDMIVSKVENNIVFSEKHPTIKIDSKILEFMNVDSKFISYNVKIDHIVKFYLLNGIHAAMAYMGKNWGYKYIDQVAVSPEWKEVKYSIKKHYISFLIKKYNLENKDLDDYFEKTQERLKVSLGDTLDRVGRNPKIKTDKNERLSPLFKTEYWDLLISGSLKIKCDKN